MIFCKWILNFPLIIHSEKEQQKKMLLLFQDPLFLQPVKIFLPYQGHRNCRGGRNGQLPPQILTKLVFKPVSFNDLVLMRAPSDFSTFCRPRICRSKFLDGCKKISIERFGERVCFEK